MSFVCISYVKTKERKPVLILILLDCSIQQLGLQGYMEPSFLVVSILVILDCSLQPKAAGGTVKAEKVSILVILDCSLQP